MHSTYNNEDFEHEQKEEDDTIVVDLVPPYAYSPPSKVSTSPSTENGKFHYIIRRFIFSNH